MPWPEWRGLLWGGERRHDLFPAAIGSLVPSGVFHRLLVRLPAQERSAPQRRRHGDGLRSSFGASKCASCGENGAPARTGASASAASTRSPARGGSSASAANASWTPAGIARCARSCRSGDRRRSRHGSPARPPHRRLEAHQGHRARTRNETERCRRAALFRNCRLVDRRCRSRQPDDRPGRPHPARKLGGAGADSRTWRRNCVLAADGSPGSCRWPCGHVDANGAERGGASGRERVAAAVQANG